MPQLHYPEDFDKKLLSSIDKHPRMGQNCNVATFMAIEDEAARRMAVAVELLAEFFPSVQILVSRPNLENPGNTEYLHIGRGDIFARRGLVQYWLDTDKNHDFAGVLAQHLKHNEE